MNRMITTKQREVSDNAPFCFKMEEELIWDVLKENNVQLSRHALSFCLRDLLKNHEDMFERMIIRIEKDNVFENVCLVYQELHPINFGRVMTYLALVFKMNDFCHIETVREAIRICVEDLKQCDMASFEIKLRISRVTPDKFWSIKNTLVFFLTFGGSYTFLFLSLSHLPKASTSTFGQSW